ncbi:E3 ubiquitin-protein ligase PDZRN3-like [Pseudorasbora parva]|uniref:E3 ubiquitin-protein ligase PDZRN3-like n=1 Tax=Pseudorasbora parva TaxID=51549 RepID=UPI00351DF833
MGCRLSGPWMGDGMGVRGQDLTHLQKREAFRILASYEQPITLQIEGRGRSLQYSRKTDCSTQTERLWDSCSLPHLQPSDRMYYNHMTLPVSRRDGSRYEFLPNSPRDLEHRERLSYNEPEFSSSQAQNCLIGCCRTGLEEPRSFQSQTDDEEYMMEKPLGYLPLHHELDSGLGWTDGSFHQGELSGLETEEGPEECHAPAGGGSPSSESFISSELSDSGFYSVSTGEFLRFQRLLEKRMRHYNTRMHHQGEPCSRERRDSQIKHPLEAIPETLTVQPQNVCVGPRGLSRVSSVQYRKAERPCLNRHSSSSGSLLLSACSTPSGQRRPHPNSAGMLRRSRTLHHRPAPMEYRRRASHPASPNYCSTTLHPCSHGAAPHANLPEEPRMHAGTHAMHTISQPSLISPVDEHRYMPPNLQIRASTEPQIFVTEPPPAPQPSRQRDGRFHTLSHTPSQDANDTWPKPANRASAGGGGLYSTLEGHMPTAAARKTPSGNLRAMRNQMLRDRASRLADERSGMSTDEESHGEVRMGRYWSRTERREHVMQKQRQQRGVGAATGLMHGGGMVGGVNGDSYSTVLELSQRKLSRLRNRKLLDDWTTVEELLTHGTRLGGDALQLPSSLLTVTTV